MMLGPKTVPNVFAMTHHRNAPEATFPSEILVPPKDLSSAPDETIGRVAQLLRGFTDKDRRHGPHI